MGDFKVLLTAGTGAGVFVWFLIWIVKNVMIDLSRKERWVIFGLLYVPTIFCLIYVTMSSDGRGANGKGKESQQIQQQLKQNTINTIIYPLKFLISTAFGDEIVTHTSLQEFCGVQPKEYDIQLTFNSDKPYYVNPGKTTLRLVLQDIDLDRRTSTIEINDDGQPINKNTIPAAITLSINQSFEFSFKECRFKITNVGFDSFTESLRYLFRTRQIAKIRIDKV